jgi:hypothetical protein
MFLRMLFSFGCKWIKIDVAALSACLAKTPITADHHIIDRLPRRETLVSFLATVNASVFTFTMTITKSRTAWGVGRVGPKGSGQSGPLSRLIVDQALYQLPKVFSY